MTDILKLPLQKRCASCLKYKDFDYFSKDKQQKHDLKPYCKFCVSVRGRRYITKNREKTKRLAQLSYQRNKKYYSTKSKIIVASKSNKYKAGYALRNAVRLGKIKRGVCNVCGSPKTDGHHHKGYSPENWLNVVWLCRQHHVLLEKKPYYGN